MTMAALRKESLDAIEHDDDVEKRESIARGVGDEEVTIDKRD